MLFAMTIRRLLAPALLTLLLVPGIRAATEAPATELKQGMPAEAVLKLLGRPDQIKPIKAPEGKAESWVYSREIRQRVEQFNAVSPDIVTSTVDANGVVRQITSPGRVETHEIRYVTVETTEVLMFNDHFVVQKKSVAEHKI